MQFIRFGNLTPQIHKIPKNEDEWGYHTAPTKKGFYAFPKGFIEMFLVGGSGAGSLKNGRFSYLKDKNGKRIEISLNEIPEFFKQYKWVYKKYKGSVILDVSKLNKNEWDDEDLDDDGDPIYIEYLTRFYLSPKNTYLDKDIEDRFPEDQRDIKCQVLVENNPIRFEYNGLIWHHLDDDRKFEDKIIKHINTWVLTDIKTYEKILNRYVAKNKYRYIYDVGHKKCDCYKGIHVNYGTAPYRYSKDEFEVYIESIQNDNKKFPKV